MCWFNKPKKTCRFPAPNFKTPTFANLFPTFFFDIAVKHGQFPTNTLILTGKISRFEGIIHQSSYVLVNPPRVSLAPEPVDRNQCTGTSKSQQIMMAKDLFSAGIFTGTQEIMMTKGLFSAGTFTATRKSRWQRVS